MDNRLDEAGKSIDTLGVDGLVGDGGVEGRRFLSAETALLADTD